MACCCSNISSNCLTFSCCSFLFKSISFSRSNNFFVTFGFQKLHSIIPTPSLSRFLHSPFTLFFFVCPILSSASLRISSPVALSFSFFSLAKLLFSLATFPLSMISSSNTSNSSCSGDIPEARISFFYFSLNLHWRRVTLSLTVLCERFSLKFICSHSFKDWAMSVQIFPASLLPFLCL